LTAAVPTRFSASRASALTESAEVLRPLDAFSRRPEACRKRASACSTEARNLSIMVATVSPRFTRAFVVCVLAAVRRSRSIILSRKTSTVRAMAPISSWDCADGTVTEVSPAASRFMASARRSSGYVMERPISQLNASPISMTARPTQTMKFRIRARDAANAFAALSAFSRDVAIILSAFGSTLAVSEAINSTNGWILSVLAAHCAKA
jgi:hypothetical protein